MRATSLWIIAILVYHAYGSTASGQIIGTPIQYPSPRVNPVPITAVTHATIMASLPETSVQLEWRHDPSADPTRPPPRYFLVCVYEPGPYQICRWPSAFGQMLHLSMPTQGELFSSPVNGSSDSARQYRYGVRLAFAAQTQRLNYQIGACATADFSSCTLSPVLWLNVTPHDLATTRLRHLIALGTPNREFVPVVRNDGVITSPSYSIEVKIWQVLSDASCRAITDPALVPATALAILRDGTQKPKYLAERAQIIGFRMLTAYSTRQFRSGHSPLISGAETQPMQAQYPAPPATPRPVLYLGWARTILEDGELDHSPNNNVAVSQECWW